MLTSAPDQSSGDSAVGCSLDAGNSLACSDEKEYSDESFMEGEDDQCDAGDFDENMAPSKDVICGDITSTSGSAAAGIISLGLEALPPPQHQSPTAAPLDSHDFLSFFATLASYVPDLPNCLRAFSIPALPLSIVFARHPKIEIASGFKDVTTIWYLFLFIFDSSFLRFFDFNLSKSWIDSVLCTFNINESVSSWFNWAPCDLSQVIQAISSVNNHLHARIECLS